MVTAPGYAEAYQAPLDAQVKAIETANYIVSCGPWKGLAVVSVLPALWRKHIILGPNFSTIPFVYNLAFIGAIQQENL